MLLFLPKIRTFMADKIWKVDRNYRFRYYLEGISVRNLSNEMAAGSIFENYIKMLYYGVFNMQQFKNLKMFKNVIKNISTK